MFDFIALIFVGLLSLRPIARERTCPELHLSGILPDLIWTFEEIDPAINNFLVSVWHDAHGFVEADTSTEFRIVLWFVSPLARNVEELTGVTTEHIHNTTTFFRRLYTSSSPTERDYVRKCFWDNYGLAHILLLTLAIICCLAVLPWVFFAYCMVVNLTVLCCVVWFCYDVVARCFAWI